MKFDAIPLQQKDSDLRFQFDSKDFKLIESDIGHPIETLNLNGNKYARVAYDAIIDQNHISYFLKTIPE